MDLTHLFPQEGEILRRSALTLIAKAIPRQVQTYMANPSNENTSPEKIAAAIIERAAQPVLRKKADLLNKLNNLPMTSEQRAAFSHWIRSSDITDPEELQLTFDNAQIQAAALQTMSKQILRSLRKKPSALWPKRHSSPTNVLTPMPKAKIIVPNKSLPPRIAPPSWPIP